MEVVVVDPVGDEGDDVPSIGSANWNGGRMATLHLRKLGHTRIGMIGGPVETRMGSRAFITYYLFCGIGAAVFALGLSQLMPVSPFVGASGAVLGVALGPVRFVLVGVMALATLLLLPVAYLLAAGRWWALAIPLVTAWPLVGVTPPAAYPLVFSITLVAVVLVGARARRGVAEA